MTYTFRYLWPIATLYLTVLQAKLGLQKKIVILKPQFVLIRTEGGFNY